MRGGTFTQTFNGQVEWQFAGGYFKLIATVSPVDVELWYQGRQVFTADQVSAGFYQREQFDKIKITTGALEAVTFLFAPDEGGTAGDVAIVSLPAPMNRAVDDTANIPVAGAASTLPVIAELAVTDGLFYYHVSSVADGDAQGASAVLVGTAAKNVGWNGASWDRVRADNEGAGVGALRVTQFGDAIVDAAAAFFGGGQQAAGGAGTNAMVQLWNGGAKNLYLDRAIIAIDTSADLIDLNYHNAAFGTDTTQARNKLIGGAAPTATVRRQAPAGGVGTKISQFRMGFDQARPLEFSPPIKIPPGFGVHFERNATNIALEAHFEWREK